MLMSRAVTASVESAASAITASSKRRDSGPSGSFAGLFMGTPQEVRGKPSRSGLGMADRVMTAGAFYSAGSAVHDVAINCRSNRLVAAPAGILGNCVIEFCDFNRVGKMAGGEIKGMPEAVICFDRVFPDEVVRSVAVVAGRGGVMARFKPGVVLCLHDVAVRAGRGIVGQVRVTLRVEERVGREPACNAEQECGRQADCEPASHGICSLRNTKAYASANRLQS